MFVTYVKVALTYLRHGLDPLAPVGRNAGKAADRFSDSEKEFVIHASRSGVVGDWLRDLLYPGGRDGREEQRGEINK